MAPLIADLLLLGAPAPCAPPIEAPSARPPSRRRRTESAALAGGSSDRSARAPPRGTRYGPPAGAPGPLPEKRFVPSPSHAGRRSAATHRRSWSVGAPAISPRGPPRLARWQRRATERSARPDRGAGGPRPSSASRTGAAPCSRSRARLRPWLHRPKCLAGELGSPADAAAASRTYGQSPRRSAFCPSRALPCPASTAR